MSWDHLLHCLSPLQLHLQKHQVINNTPTLPDCKQNVAQKKVGEIKQIDGGYRALDMKMESQALIVGEASLGELVCNN